ncbi:hypothetical protein GN244_ATG09828 [Phytophthora infestans]|uniref:Uncharacterized protein n=1 Tax=Phytophthora infestans TaxID=4787 RepID=A0A833T747_PHYIN|nr:hypothetical protein GN244_ATG09828 [Phytophthora infestans]
MERRLVDQLTSISYRTYQHYRHQRLSVLIHLPRIKGRLSRQVWQASRRHFRRRSADDARILLGTRWSWQMELFPAKTCERIIHQLGETHVERVRHHLQKKCTKRLKTKTITSCFPAVLSARNVTEFKKIFALWFYSTGTAFHKVSYSSLLQGLQILHPGVEIPSARELAATEIKGKSVINNVLDFEGESYFLESHYTGSTSHDAVFLAADVKRVLRSVKLTTIVAVVTDSKASSQLMWSTLQKDFSTLSFMGVFLT